MRKNLLFIPGPVTVSEPVLAAMGKPMIDHRGPRFAELLERVSARLQPVFGTKEKVVTLGSSGTGGLEAVLVNLFSPGDKLLALPLGVFGQRFIAIARTYGCNVEVIETEPGHAADAQRLAERLRADTNREIAGILLTHNETSTGVQQDMAQIARAVGDHPAITLVDSVSGLGASEFRMDDWNLDAVVTASQKVFAAPPGVAMVALSKRAQASLDSAKIPSFYFSLKKALEFEKIGQTPWTPPVSILYALDVALELYEAEGARNVYARHSLYAQAIREAALALDLELFAQPGALSDTVVSIKAKEGMDVAALLKKLRDERGVVLSGAQAPLTGKLFRIGTMGDVSQTDVLGMIGALEIALLEQDVPVHIGKGVQAALKVFLKPDVGQKTAAQTDAQTMVAPR
ncbi:MAG TPA: alanine--glyoxylate aminotransferase family protein [Candidatus Baltobacteraceae bacterium]|nr:alanine--glyoxylate aminotransferase family protein [Candidatus Baltobacteraceae bacterium]